MKTDLIIFLSESCPAGQLIPHVACMTGAKRVIALIDNKAWLPLGLKGQVQAELNAMGVDRRPGRSSSDDQRHRIVFSSLLLKLRNPSDPSDPLGPEWVEELFRDFTALGGPGVLTLVSLAAAGFLAMERRVGSVILLLVAVGGGVLLVSLLKLGFDRPRPDPVAHGVYTRMSSFPSGHSKLSAVTYLTPGGLLSRMQPRPWLKTYLFLLAMLLTFLVGTSRVYLGVHWPTDVLAGWTVGGAWALLCWLLAGWLQLRTEPQPRVC